MFYKQLENVLHKLGEFRAKGAKDFVKDMKKLFQFHLIVPLGTKYG
jgi:hypothetical protein